MQLKTFYYRLFTFLILLGSSSCSLEDDQVVYNFVGLRATSAELPEAFELNKSYTITVNFQLPDGCTQFEGFDVRSEGNTTRYVSAVGIQRGDVACTQALRESSATFRFICLYRGTYKFRFWSGQNSDDTPTYIDYEVPVIPSE